MNKLTWMSGIDKYPSAWNSSQNILTNHLAVPIFLKRTKHLSGISFIWKNKLNTLLIQVDFYPSASQWKLLQSERFSQPSCRQPSRTPTAQQGLRPFSYKSKLTWKKLETLWLRTFKPLQISSFSWRVIKLLNKMLKLVLILPKSDWGAREPSEKPGIERVHSGARELNTTKNELEHTHS